MGCNISSSVTTASGTSGKTITITTKSIITEVTNLRIIGCGVFDVEDETNIQQIDTGNSLQEDGITFNGEYRIYF